jgi:SAM-dependent methyltransferase
VGGGLTHLRALLRLVVEWAHLAIDARRLPDDELFLRAVYHACLKREPDREGRGHYSEILRRRGGRCRVVGSILQSNEFSRVGGLPTNPLLALHESRVQLVQRLLPAAEVVVDLGGAAHDCPEGALLAMGYPHSPAEVMIIDLPPDRRMEGADGAERAREWVTSQGCRVRYVYQSMAVSWPIADCSVDLVWSGESIEHVSEAEADFVCRQAYRVLKEGGHFCLDTPNAALTRLQSPDEFIHPEHQVEYSVEELWRKVERWGFAVVESAGICPMPRSLREGVFDEAEMVHSIGLSDVPEEGYMFFVKAVKPVLRPHCRGC